MNDTVLYPLDYQFTLARIIREKLPAPILQETLERLKRSDFGECTSCGTVIPYIEITANPAARLCRRCCRA